MTGAGNVRKPGCADRFGRGSTLRGRGWVRAAACLLSALVLTGAGPVSSDRSRPLVEPPKPRQLSEAERAAVELVAAYFQGGPVAWWEELAADAPLRRLGREAAIQEIGVRAGPADGATWQLLTPGPKLEPQTAVFGVEFASGLDETLVLRLVDQGGWKIAGLRISAEPAGPRPGSLPGSAAAKPSAPRHAVSAAVSGQPAPPASWPAALALLALGLAGAAGTFLLARAGKRRPALGAAAATVVAAAGMGLWMWAAPSPAAPRVAKKSPAPAADAGLLRLAALAPLRQALADGGDRAEIERRLATPPADPRLREVQELWRAQYLLLESNLTAADATLSRIPGAKSPLADLLHARLAFRRLQREETKAFYDAAIEDGLDIDALHLEAAFAKSFTDQADLAEVELTLLTQMGSRLSEPWYTAARRAAAEDRMAESEDLLLRAWQLEPAPRAELFDDPVFAFLVTRPKLFPLFKFGDPEEPRLPPRVPEAAAAALWRAARHLRPVAAPRPRHRRAVGAGGRRARAGGHRRRRRQDVGPARRGESPRGSAVADQRRGPGRDPAAPPAADRPGRGPGPGRAEPLGRSARPYRAPGRATSSSAPASPRPPARPGAPATDRNERPASSSCVWPGATSPAAGPPPGRSSTSPSCSPPPASTTPRSSSLKRRTPCSRPRGERRRKQFALDRDLATSYGSYPLRPLRGALSEGHGGAVRARRDGGAGGRAPASRALDPRGPEQAGRGLPLPDQGLLRELRRRHGRGRPLRRQGAGAVRRGPEPAPGARLDPLPRAGPRHDRRGDPRSGAALVPGRAGPAHRDGTGRLNPMPDLARTGRVLSFPTIDPILRGFAEAQLVDLAYAEAAWTVDFLEARFGTKAIHRMIAAYAAGKTTEQALQQACGLSPAEFDRAFWQWGTTQAPQTRELEVRRYDVEYRAQVNREHKNDVSAILRVGGAEQANNVATRQKEAAEEQRRKMAAWYATYAASAGEIRLAVNSIAQRYRGKTGGDVVPACTRLATDIPGMLDNPALWASPDPDVNAALRNAYRTLGDLGTACLAGRETEIRFLIIEAERGLGEASVLFKPYGLGRRKVCRHAF